MEGVGLFLSMTYTLIAQSTSPLPSTPHLRQEFTERKII